MATDPEAIPFHRHQGADNQPCTWCGANADRAVHSQTYARRNHREWMETPPVEGDDDG
jgi:hypothetical protein